MNPRIVIVFIYAGYMVMCADAQDTYLDALQNSHNNEFGASDGGYQFNPVPSEGGYQYNPPKDISYLPPATSPPVPVYGPPQTQIYNAPPPTFYKPAPPLPYHSHDYFWEKLKSKISLFTIGKLLLKLLIFKKAVKFFGIICLLMVLPKIKNLFNDNMSMEDEGMSSKIVDTDKGNLEKHINEIYEFIMSSIQEYDEERR